ncbi:MAG TPA: hypothetical protein VFB52_12700, partial [Solirubrobacterales bacterium]|nr:hypothetical protein [Solirubrobacterales bacterium]
DVQRFGVEASAAERQEAAEAVGSFIEGSAEKRWQPVCQSLSKAIRGSFEEAAVAQGDDGGCPQVLGQIAARTPTYMPEDNMARAVGSLRVEGNTGYALYRGTDGLDYAIPVDREGGHWKVAAMHSLMVS